MIYVRAEQELLLSLDFSFSSHVIDNIQSLFCLDSEYAALVKFIVFSFVYLLLIF